MRQSTSVSQNPITIIVAAALAAIAVVLIYNLTTLSSERSELIDKRRSMERACDQLIDGSPPGEEKYRAISLCLEMRARSDREIRAVDGSTRASAPDLSGRRSGGGP